MKLGNKGFAISGVLYSLLIIFVTLFIGVLTILASTKFSLDKVKKDIIDKLETLAYRDTILNGADPVLKEGMIPVVIEADGTVKKADMTGKWYDYSMKKWANSVTVSEVNRSSYEAADAGTVIKESDILTYFVWIPRYKYKLWYVGATDSGTTLNANQVHSIDIIFEGKNTAKSKGSADGTYLTHPAFTFGDEELNGIWVGKFETGYNGASSAADAKVAESNSSKVIIKPSMITSTVYSWRAINVSNSFKTAKNMNISDNVFGLSTDSDTHMMKNIEWGAVAYLSHSEYGTCTNGICKEVYINNNKSYMTGCGGNSVNENSDTACKNQYGTKIDGVYNQSTNGNISGIFDMSGGSQEYVMGYTTKAETEYGSSGFDFTTFPENKYVDLYSSTMGTQYSNRILGDASGELGPFLTGTTPVSSWYNDYADFVNANFPWFKHGGDYNSGENAGIFDFRTNTGVGGSAHSFRIVLV